MVDGRKLRRGVVSAVGFFACESEDGTIDLNDLEYVLSVSSDHVDIVRSKMYIVDHAHRTERARSYICKLGR